MCGNCRGLFDQAKDVDLRESRQDSLPKLGCLCGAFSFEVMPVDRQPLQSVAYLEQVADA